MHFQNSLHLLCISREQSIFPFPAVLFGYGTLSCHPSDNKTIKLIILCDVIFIDHLEILLATYWYQLAYQNGISKLHHQVTIRLFLCFGNQCVTLKQIALKLKIWTFGLWGFVETLRFFRRQNIDLVKYLHLIIGISKGHLPCDHQRWCPTTVGLGQEYLIFYFLSNFFTCWNICVFPVLLEVSIDNLLSMVSTSIKLPKLGKMKMLVYLPFQNRPWG